MGGMAGVGVAPPQPKPKPGGGIEPPEGTSPGPGHIPKPGGGTWKTNRHEEAPRDKKSPVSGPNETQSPTTHRRPEKTHTTEGDRSPDQTRPPDPQRRPTDPPESALTSNYRSISGLEVDGAAEFGALRRLRRRPRRQPAVSAAARAWAVTRGGQARLRGLHSCQQGQLESPGPPKFTMQRWSIFCFQRHASPYCRLEAFAKRISNTIRSFSLNFPLEKRISNVVRK